MTTSVLTTTIIERLEAVGYRRLPTPFQVASVRFDFTAVLRGPDARGLDRVLIVDTSVGQHGDNSGERTRQRIEALSRALDISGSRLVLTAILAGAPLPSTDVEALSHTCRVLTVDAIDLDEAGQAATPEATRDLDDRLRVLLPLQLENGHDTVADPAGEIEQRLTGIADKRLTQALLAASARGDRAVSRVLGDVLDAALKPGVPS
jgi:hypothetical protein